MERIDKFSVVSGIVLVFGGTVLLIISIIIWPLVVYGLVSLILGIVILLTLKQQEHIEPIKKSKK
jgi:hypothetical protein